MLLYKRFGWLLVLILVFAPQAVFAGDNINVGDTINFSDACPGCASQGGPFYMHDTTTGVTVETFCVEVNEFISLSGTNYTVHSIGGAVHGGASGGDPDPVSWVTAALYLLYRDGSLATVWDFDMSPGVLSNVEKDIVQALIWLQEGEITGPAYGITQAMINEANSGLLAAVNANGNANALNHVAAVNPIRNGVHKQSQLVMVPEPSTILLLGTGLLGLATLLRRRKQASS